MGRRLLFIFLGVAGIILLIVPFKSRASTTVDISNNGEGSSSHVSVKNSVNSTSTNSSGDTSSSTYIRIETNGKVKEYKSDKPEDIKIESEDGKSSVHVTTNTSTSSSRIDNEIKEKIEKRREYVKNKVQEKRFDLGEFIFNIFSLRWLFK